MKPDTELTTVVFRKWKTLRRVHQSQQVIAFFPDQVEPAGCVGSYMHIGQHAAATYPHPDTVPATPAEYADLKAELEGLGYRLRIVKRRVRK